MTLLPFDPHAVYYLWFLKWREHVRCARLVKENDGYCRAACIAQTIYVCEMALETVKLKKAGIIQDD